MIREDVVNLLVDFIIGAELAAFRRHERRRPDGDTSDPMMHWPSIHTKLLGQFDSKLVAGYVQCQRRFDHPDLQPYHHHPSRQAAPVPSSASTDSFGPLPHPPARPVVPAAAGVNPPDLETHTPGLAESTTWPEMVSQSTKDHCVSAFNDGTNISVQETCSVCSRRTFSKDLLFTKRHLVCRRVRADSIDLEILRIHDEHLLTRPGGHFRYDDASLNDLALDRAGMHNEDGQTFLDVCDECHHLLTSQPSKLPPLALANGNIRGWLPADLQDCTWFEERLCALHLASACVVRLYDLTAPGAPPERQRIMKGHACAFPLHTVSTATKLPWAIADGGPLVSCIIIGPRKPRLSDLRGVFKVRREKVRSLLRYLRDNFAGYPQFSIDEQSLESLPEDDVPAELMRCVAHSVAEEPRKVFDEETKGLDIHPALAGLENPEDDYVRTFLEYHGLIDIHGVTVPAHIRTATALANTTGSERPDIIVRHGSSFIEDYNNPSLFPGMFPLLFPWGTGGFEADRQVPLSFARQASHLLDLADPAFRRHWSYMFVACNIKQRRAIHIGSRLACKSKDFASASKIIQELDPETIKAISQHLADGGSLSELTSVEARIFALLKKCELVSSHVPGSKAVMNQARSEIRSFVGQFGIFQLFLTLNPAPIHSPVFQVFYGDSINLNIQVPTLPTTSERGIRVADDPVSASDYFHFHICAVFQYLFGWDVRRKRSSAQGGILGRLAAFYMVKEHTMRGQLHGHILLWLEGGLNPSKLREFMSNDEAFQERYLNFMDDIISHSLPNPTSDRPVESHGRVLRAERAPDPREELYDTQFAEDHRLLGEEVQRHICKLTCYKGGRLSCRFLFPHELHLKSSYDPETSSIELAVKDATINWHNPTLLVATRHNHDLKSVQSGRSGLAAASYITSYATKSEETPENQVKMIKTVYERMEENGMVDDSVKSLLSRCVMQFGRERQLHAQQVATYMRDLGDTWSSHKTVPMMTGRILMTVQRLYGSYDPTPIDSTPAVVPPPSTCTESPTLDSSRVASAGIDDAGIPLDTPSTEAQSADPSADVSTSMMEGDDDLDGGEDFMPLSSSSEAHQVDDYLHRGDSLQELNFFDFVRFCKLIPLPSKLNKNHHLAKATHPNAKQKCHAFTPTKPIGIPRSFGRFPRSNGTEQHGDGYCASMLAHFKPFSISNPLKIAGQSYEDAFSAYNFSATSRTTMANWQALTECDDARDADQLLRRKRESNRSEAVDGFNPNHAGDHPSADIDMEIFQGKHNSSDQRTLEWTNALSKSGWFGEGLHLSTAPPAPLLQSDCPRFTKARRKVWAKQVSEIETTTKAVASAPRASTGVLAENLGVQNFAAEPSVTIGQAMLLGPIPALETQRLCSSELPPHILIERLVKERKLNKAQELAFTIVARHFFTELHGVETDPLRLLMHGEGGTGKTVVVLLLRELLERYGKGAEILFMAPTGKAASAIGGSTQHSAFGLKVHKRATPSEDLGSTAQDDVTPRRISHLQKTCQPVRWIFFDEVSMTSSETMCDIDQALRVGKQRLDAPFGNINVIFAGDLCQLPPVLSTPLYNPAAHHKSTADVRTKAQLGRAVWLEIKTVVHFEEQMRMKDADMAAALRRLRVRQSIPDDVQLFNDNVIRSVGTPSGVCLHGKPEVIVLAKTNDTVRSLNHRRAALHAVASGGEVAISHACDSAGGVIPAATREALLAFHGSSKLKAGLGRLPLFPGMPVVYKGGNTSVALGVTNGAFATVAGYNLQTDRFGFAVATGVLLKFPRLEHIQLADLPPGAFPIAPVSTTFNFRERNDAPVLRVSRSQLPLQPGFAMTVHSAQGITAEGGVVVDLRKGGFEAYVAASRATTRGNLYLLAPVKIEDLKRPGLPTDLLKELRRLRELAAATTSTHGHIVWTIDAVRLKRSAEAAEEPNAKRARLSTQ
ncbi:hypothetical protein CF319_g5894 [Tilletia indica]|nr:hypothetical protein CF319_g5894 [Tilletia indica]